MMAGGKESIHTSSCASAPAPPLAKPRITVGMGTCGQAAGARTVLAALNSAVDNMGISADVITVGCRGLCFAEPLVELMLPDGPAYSWGNVDSSLAAAIAGGLRGFQEDGTHSSLLGVRYGAASLESLLLDTAFDELQSRRVMENCGKIDPFSVEEYLACGGYSALETVLSDASPEAVVEAVASSGLRGRGGAGFPTGRKWQAMRDAIESERFFIVNADEGDPGAYMDRGLLESDPHRVLEGLIIASYATGCSKAYFFIRAEYPLAVRTVEKAIRDAYREGLLGKRIFGSEFSLDVGIVRGAGAFLCGESTAMVNVLEGGECTTRPKPPHLVEKGLWGKPTCINNVETLANIPLIIARGSTWFRSVGTSDSPGTKIFSLTGAVGRGGLIEVPLGSTLESVVFEIGKASNPKAVQIGGPSGTILPVSLKNLQISYEGLDSVDGMMGSGGFVVIGNDRCVVETAKYLVAFSEKASCKKCHACREALRECAAILERICAGEGCEEDLIRLEELSLKTRSSKLCGLGRTALNPVLSSLRHFHEEYQAHLRGECPGLTCEKLVSYEIDSTKCQGERCCLLTCPGNAIKGPFGKPGRIVSRLCQKCGMCAISCPYSAVRKVTPALRA